MRAGLITLMLAACGGLSPSEFYVVAHRAGTCAATDTCVVMAPLNTCTCSAVVRQTELANVEAAAKSVSCGGMMAKCIVPLRNAHCENNTCVAQ